MIKIAPSILSADFTRLGEEINSVNCADYVHFDVMDGVFVPNISFGIPVLKSVRKITEMTLDVHLMLKSPSQYASRFAKAGGDIITFHVEAEVPEAVHFTIDEIRKLGKKAGLAVKPETPVSSVLPFIDLLDLVLIMTVEPGYGGQEFMPAMLPKISELREIIDMRGIKCEIEVDGGINHETAKLCISAGADVLVAGSDVFFAENRSVHIAELRNK